MFILKRKFLLKTLINTKRRASKKVYMSDPINEENIFNLQNQNIKFHN